MKLILNGIGFKKQILSFFKKSNNEFNEDPKLIKLVIT
jgi:hypothetical protein